MMLNGKRIKFSKKAIICASAILLAVCAAVGATLAYMIASDGPVDNEFTPSVVTTSVVENTSNGDVKSDVKIKNTGDTEAYIRAYVVFNWQDEDGNIFGSTPVENYDYSVSWNVSDKCTNDVWVKATDGYYYYTSPVAPGEETTALISSCHAAHEYTIGKTTYYLSVDIVCSGIQSNPTTVVTTYWTSGVSGMNEEYLVVRQ